MRMPYAPTGTVLRCHQHGFSYWSEDGCPMCAAEDDAEEKKRREAEAHREIIRPYEGLVTCPKHGPFRDPEGDGCRKCNEEDEES